MNLGGMWCRDLYELLAREQDKPPLSNVSLDRVSDWFEVHPQFIRCEESVALSYRLVRR